jgi:hypothetical protein
MKFFIVAATTILIGITVTAPAAPIQNGAGPDPTMVGLISFSYGGSGCPQGSAALVLSADRTSLALTMEMYTVSHGPGIRVTENRKNCQLNAKLHYPSGWQFSIFSTTYSGYASLDSGVTGLLKSTYYFSGSTLQVRNIKK